MHWRRCFTRYRLAFNLDLIHPKNDLIKLKQIYQPKQTLNSFSNIIFVPKSVSNKCYLCSSQNNLPNNFQIHCKNTNLPKIFQQNAKYIASYNEDHKKDYLIGTFGSKFFKNLPAPLSSYSQLMRLDKPTGTWLLLLPCYWSISLSTNSGSLPSISNILLFTIGAIMMRSAGCIINDILDKKFDGKVERTKNRPLVTNEIKLSDAVALLGSLLGSSLLVLIQFDINSIFLGASSLLLVGTYPLFKRFTYWPQLILGMTFNWGALLGWSANCNGDINLMAAIPLYMAGIAWTMIYDTIYAHQDKNDDYMLGLKSTAIKFGDKTHRYLHLFSILMTMSLVQVGYQTEQTWPYYLSLAAVFGHLIHNNKQLDINSMESCAKSFKKNSQIGWILLMGIIISTLIKKPKIEGTCRKVPSSTSIENNINEPINAHLYT